MNTNKDFTTVIDIITLDEHLVAYNYNAKEDQIFIPKDLKEKILTLVDDKDLIKSAIRKVLELKESDIVIIKNEGIFIKIFDDSKRRLVAKEEANTIANRYNGLSEEELKSFYNDFFSKEENEKFFYEAAQQYVKTYFLEQQISNEMYEKNVFSNIQTIITNKLIATLDTNSEFFNGFSGYLFRIKFKEVFEFIADFILMEISRSNPYMNDFLKYYALNIIAIGNDKYKVPTLEAENGLKWNVISILSIVKVYARTDASIQMFKEDAREISQELQAMRIEGLSPMDFQTALFKEKESLENTIVKSMMQIDKYSDTMDLTKEEKQKSLLREEIKGMKEKVQELRDQKTLITSKMVKKNILLKYVELEKELTRTFRKQKAEENILEKNKAAYLSIKGALVKALTSKKQKI